MNYIKHCIIYILYIKKNLSFKHLFQGQNVYIKEGVWSYFYLISALFLYSVHARGADLPLQRYTTSPAVKL